MATRAMFRVEKRGPQKGEIIIVFPDDEANPGMVQFFSPRDGHGEASIQWVQSETRPARPGEFENLKRSYEQRLGSSLVLARRRSRTRSQRDTPQRATWAERVYETRLARERVNVDFLPLFDHLIRLAEDARRRGRPQEAGRLLDRARRLTKYGTTPSPEDYADFPRRRGIGMFSERVTSTATRRDRARARRR